MPRTLVITSLPSDWSELGEITCKAMKAWCDLHGYEFFAWTADLKDYWFNVGSRSREHLPIKGFVKLDLFLRFLPEYERVVWLDADMIITDYAWTVERLVQAISPSRPQVAVGYDWNAHNTTVIIADNTVSNEYDIASADLLYDYMWACNNTGRKFFLGDDWVEMSAMRFFAQTPPYDQILGYQSVAKICPVLHTEYIEAGVPARVSEKYGWRMGAFSLHLSALHINRRIELAREFAERFPCPK